MADLSFRVLGSLRVSRGGVEQPLQATKPRRLLATLLLNPNRFVSTELLVDVLWAGQPPRSAVANVRTYVRSLRETISVGGGAELTTHPSGYSIAVPTEALDAGRLAAHVADAAALRATDPRGAAAAYERGLRLWRGRPLSDLDPAPAWEGALRGLDELYRTTIDGLVALRLATDDHAEAVGLLRRRLDDEPYDEGLWCRLVETMLAAGQHHEARLTYDQAVRVLAEELDIEPGEALRAVGALTVGATVPTADVAPHPARQAPSQLPFDQPDFTGRERELDQLVDLVTGNAPGRPPIAVVFGAAGTGKTTLAVRLGHLVADAFPDGQLYLDMRATTRPRDPASALHALLHGLGVPELAIPKETDRRAAMLRSELAGRRVLIVLDDVESAAQVALLLPGTGTSALVITSRRRLTDLTGPERIRLDTLADGPAARLLEQGAGGRLDRTEEAAAEIVRLCGNLPLAIRIAASRLAQRDDLTPAELARRLRDERNRLDELAVGDLAVRSSADLSYWSLEPDEARLYRLIGLLGAVEFPAWLLTAALPEPAVERCLTTMLEANLLRVSGVDATGHTRYRMHGLLRLHASELASQRHTEEATADLTAVLSAMLDRTRAAGDRLPVRFFGVTESLSPAAYPGPALPTPADAIAWHDAEQANLVPLLHAARQYGRHEHAWRLAAAWTPYFDLRGHFDFWHEAHEMGVHSARAVGSRLGEATILCGLGQLALYRDDWGVAFRSFSTAQRIFTSLDDQQGFGVATAGLATWHRFRDQHDKVLPLAMAALEAFLAAGDLSGEAVARSAIGSAWLVRGDTETAETWLTDAFDLAVRLEDPHREAQVRRRLATLRERQGDTAAAIVELRAALTLFERLGDDHCASRARASLGGALLTTGDYDAARTMFLEALAVVHRLGDKYLEAQTTAQLARCGPQRRVGMDVGMDDAPR